MRASIRSGAAACKRWRRIRPSSRSRLSPTRFSTAPPAATSCSIQFAGSGTIILAAEKVGRIARGIEFEPRYVDVAIKRWQDMTKLEAVLVDDGRTFAEVAEERVGAWRRRSVPSAERQPRLCRRVRRPPRSTQFKPGDSGNPKGRPKGSRPVGALLQEIIQQKIAVTENGKTRRLPVLEIMLRRLANEAMRGEQRSVKFLLTLLEHYGDSSQTTLQLGEMLAEDAEILAEYLDETSVAESSAFNRRKGRRAMNANTRIVQALLRHDLRAFVHKVFVALTLGQTYVRSWHIDAIIYQLERIRRGEIRRLIINMPPRSLKSITASVAFPAFLLGHDPTKRIICVSYSGDLAKKHSNDFRAVLESAWYRDIFPDTRIGLYKNTETEIELTSSAAFAWRPRSAAR